MCSVILSSRPQEHATSFNSRTTMENNRLQTDAHVHHRPPFRSAVVDIDNSLHDEDVDSMKFLCQGLVVASKLKRADNVLELINLLESASLVSEDDTFLLADLLQYIQRIDVLENIGYEEREVVFQRHQQGSKIKPFYVLLFQIAQELPDEDVRKATYMYGKVPRSQKVSSGMDLFTVMVQHQAIAPDNVGLLVHIFQSVERQDIVELINRYTATQGRSVMDSVEQQFIRAMSLKGINVADTFPQEQPQPQKRSGFARGLGPSIHDIDVTDRWRNPPPSVQASDNSSNINSPPSSDPLSPSAPPESMPSFRQESAGSLVNQSNSAAALPADRNLPSGSEAPEGYDNYDIPWVILSTLSTNVPAEYWLAISSRLGVPVTSEWSNTRATRHHILAVLKRWLELPETKALDPWSTKIFLVKALAASDAQLMAREIACQMKIDFRAIMQDSVSTIRSSNCEENDVASTGSAVPESMTINQPRSFVNVEVVGQRSATGQRSLLPVSPVPFYKMDRIPRGFCVIINNRDFYKDPQKVEAKQMISREGTDVDRDKLRMTFEQLNFRVALYENCTDYDMIRLMQDISCQNHADFDCLVCCILTHGVQGALYGVNGMTVPIRDMTMPFRAQACPSLCGKPKLFFLQACQGREKQEGRISDMQTDCLQVETDSPPELIPNESDFLLGYATVPGFVSYRSKTRGSWYITKLTELLNKYAYDHDILDILTLVNYEVGKGDALIEGGQYKQSPAPMYSLRKKLIFTRAF